LNPATLVRNPVMLLVWVGAAFTTVLAVAEPFLGGPGESGGTPVPPLFTAGIAAWLWLTVLFANVAESVAEGRGKAQAATLRKTRTSTMARRVVAGWDPSHGRGLVRRTSARRRRDRLGGRAHPGRRRHHRRHRHRRRIGDHG
jgi:high-affinity K+ transport system ATPase subunit B